MAAGKRRSQRLSAIAAGIGLYVFASPQARALIEVGTGNQPVEDAGWPAGALEVANLKSRLGWWVGPPLGGGMHVFLYRVENTAQLNEARVLFAAIQTTKLVVVLHDGPHESFALRDHATPNDARGDRRLGGLRRAQPQAEARVDFTFTVWNPASWHRLYNSPRGVFFGDRPQFHQPVDPPTLDIYVGRPLTSASTRRAKGRGSGAGSARGAAVCNSMATDALSSTAPRPANTACRPRAKPRSSRSPAGRRWKSNLSSGQLGSPNA